jgi:DNA-directed RNA polymerase sigma subunit (sigma70/sigma32)
MQEYLSWLTDEELLIVSLTFGVNHLGAALSKAELADFLGVKVQYVQKKLGQALKKLNDPEKKPTLTVLASTYLSVEGLASV